MAFCFKNTKEYIIMTVENEENFEKKTFVDFAEKKFYLIKLEIIVT